MADQKALNDPNETPEDVATLYSWANLHGAKYRDFSASRAQTREKARQRVQQAIEEERERARKQAEIDRAVESRRAADAEEEARRANLVAQQAAEQAAQVAARQASQRINQQTAQEIARQSAQQNAWPQQPQADRYGQATTDPFAPQPDRSAQRQSDRVGQPQADRAAQAPAPHYSPEVTLPAGYRPGSSPASSPALGQPHFSPMREESVPQPRHSWAPAENPGRPAWLAADRSEIAVPAMLHAPEDTLQGSRDRLTSRWFALKGVFEGASAPPEPTPVPAASRAPVLAIFSLAGGVGKTSMVATLGRALSARGERVLLVDTAAFGLLPFFFGARDQRVGMLRTFSPPAASGDAPVQMVTIDPDALGPEAAPQETLAAEIGNYARGASRVIVDLATASAGTTRRLLRMAPMVLVPVVPDMNSVVSVGSIDSFFQQHGGAHAKSAQPFYVLNQFDSALPLHLDVREVLRERLGDRLLPFVLRRAPAVSEALAEGMTVMDYAPNSTVAEDFGSLAGWVKSISAPANTSYRGVRWSER
jgi:cellulose synthase operon protein YhjQ